MALFVISILVVVLFAGLVHLLFKERITFQESLVQCGAATVVGIVILMGMYYRNTTDHAIVNGYVKSKARVEVSCSHSYRCNCYTTCSGSGSSRTCTQHCSTCYEHRYDVDWNVYTSVGNLSIDRINRQGTHEPPRWTQVISGEPASRTISYTNYVMAAPDSLFGMTEKEADAKYATLFPKYPQVFDYYRYNRVMQVGVTYPDADKLNARLNDSLRVLGAKRQVNIQVLFVNVADPQYRYALERHWIGGKKNDVIVLIAMNPERELMWSDTITFGRNAGNEMLAVKLRDAITHLSKTQQLTNWEVLGGIIAGTVDNEFKRKEMKDFEYLKDDYQLSQKAILWYIGIQIFLLTGTTIFFYHFELERGTWQSSRVPTFQFQRRRYPY